MPPEFLGINPKVNRERQRLPRENGRTANHIPKKLQFLTGSDAGLETQFTTVRVLKRGLTKEYQ